MVFLILEHLFLARAPGQIARFAVFHDLVAAGAVNREVEHGNIEPVVEIQAPELPGVGAACDDSFRVFAQIGQQIVEPPAVTRFLGGEFGGKLLFLPVRGGADRPAEDFRCCRFRINLTRHQADKHFLVFAGGFRRVPVRFHVSLLNGQHKGTVNRRSDCNFSLFVA